jgi:hypothetical protein
MRVAVYYWRVPYRYCPTDFEGLAKVRPANGTFLPGEVSDVAEPSDGNTVT